MSEKKISNIEPERDARLVHELRDVTEKLINQHLEVARTWDPQEVVPWENAPNYNPKMEWSEDVYPLPQGVRSALYVNELTEINLPYYTNELLSNAPEDHPLTDWSRIWTSEEWRHGDAMLNFIRLSGAFDPAELERGRISQMRSGDVPRAGSTAELISYVIMQELATAVAHRNTAKYIPKELGGKKLLGIVAGDEMLHHKFYLELGKAAIAIDPDLMVRAFKNQYFGFEMPGQSIPDFDIHAKAIAQADIYSDRHFHEEVVRPVITALGILAIDEGLSDEAKNAQNRVADRYNRFSRRLAKMDERKLNS